MSLASRRDYTYKIIDGDDEDDGWDSGFKDASEKQLEKSNIRMYLFQNYLKQSKISEIEYLNVDCSHEFHSKLEKTRSRMNRIVDRLEDDWD